MKHTLRITDASGNLLESVKISQRAADSLRQDPARITVIKPQPFPPKGFHVVLHENGKPDRLYRSSTGRESWTRRNCQRLRGIYEKHPRIRAEIVPARNELTTLI